MVIKFNFKLTINKIFSIYKILSKETLDLIYKRKCINCFCSIQAGILCKTCAKTVQNLPPFAQGNINGYKLYSAFYYEGVIKTLIHQLKFKHNKVCADYAAKYLYEYIINLKNEGVKFTDPMIVPVLTHKKNKNKRGYDNVYEISKKLSDLSGFKLDSKSLKKIKYTKPQYQLTAKQRAKNIQGSFILDKNFNHKGLVIILDDIVTTGSTLEYITSLFKEKGFDNLICLTLSKTKLFKK